MPELPDVENYRRHLAATVLRQRVENVHVQDDRILKGATQRQLRERLIGRDFHSAWRHGKFLFVRLVDDGWLILHFGMTGTLKYFKHMEDDPDHDGVRFDLANGYHLAYVSRRMLGRVGVADDAEAFVRAQGLGPDPLDPDLDEAAFERLLKKKRGGIKGALMDQRFLAGIGNVYADEILFRARIDPRRTVTDLDDGQRQSLFRALREVLETAIDCGAGSEELADRLLKDYLLPHRVDGGRCPRCATELQKPKVAGRTSYVCPRCQS